MWTKIGLVACLLFSFEALATSTIENSEPGVCDRQESQCTPTAAPQRAPLNCLEECLKDGEDPLECPYFCYDQV